MTRQKMIKTLEKIHDELMWETDDELTDHTRKWAYIFVDQALECLQKNRVILYAGCKISQRKVQHRI